MTFLNKYNSALKYRPDIDGLRAIAVLAVVLYHADISIFSGGFIGVDIFFVISGFLITSILLKDIKNNKFSMLKFWERRIRRILPALLAVIIFCLIAGWFMFLPQDYKNLGQQVFSQTFFSSNILFYLQSGYFDTANETKPLLHTWSLAVEEQFYLFFPVFIYLIWKFFKPEKLPIFVLFIAIISFLLSIYGVHNHPSATFYLLPTRAWELLIGALIAMAPSINLKNGYMRNIVATLTLLCIMIPIFLYDKTTAFPGLSALLPCAGTAFFIWLHKEQKTFISEVLSLRLVVFIGLISYSWYLWHWPLIVFTKYYFFEGATQSALIISVALSFIIAILSWRYIERPFRNNKIKINAKSPLIYAGLLNLAIIVSFSLYLHINKGVKNRWSENTIRLVESSNDKNPLQTECNKPSLEQIKNRKICETLKKGKKKSFVLWGDSHADAIAPLFYYLSEKYNRNGYILTYTGCPPILELKQKNRESYFFCKDFNDSVLDLIKSERIENVFLVSSWENWFNSPNIYIPSLKINTVEHALNNTIENLKGVNIYLMETVPTYKINPPKYLAFTASRDNVTQNNVTLSYNKTSSISKFVGTNTTSLIQPSKILCPSNEECYIRKNGDNLYYDAGHISTRGAMTLEPLFAPIFKNMKNND